MQTNHFIDFRNTAELLSLDHSLSCRSTLANQDTLCDYFEQIARRLFAYDVLLCSLLHLDVYFDLLQDL